MNIFSRIILLVFTVMFYSASPLAAGSEQLRAFGDMAQIINPVVAASVASQAKGLGHFSLVLGESLGIMGVGKYAGNKLNYSFCRRPHNQVPMPSGHTTSAWSAASYVRIQGGEYTLLAAPLYASAAITAYSRVRSKRHTVAQVIVAILLSEGVNNLAYRSPWMQQYSGITLDFSETSVRLNWSVRF